MTRIEIMEKRPQLATTLHAFLKNRLSLIFCKQFFVTRIYWFYYSL